MSERNIERLKEVRDIIEGNPHVFDYQHHFAQPGLEGGSMPDVHTCGTLGCVSGLSHLLYPESRIQQYDSYENIINYDVDTGSALALGLTYEESEWLFYPWGESGFTHSTQSGEVDLREAIDRLNWLIDGKDIAEFVSHFSEKANDAV